MNIEDLIRQEEKRQAETLNLIPSENYAYKEVLAALGSCLTDKYSEGYPKNRYYGGQENVDEIESQCQELARQLFNLPADQWHINVQPYAGAPANLAIFLAVLNPGDRILGMDMASGGHISHGAKFNLSGKLFQAFVYGVDKETNRLDYRKILAIAKKTRPKIIIAGATAYSRLIDFEQFGYIAKKTHSLLLADISHISGLISTGFHPTPFPFADFVMTTTHKMLRGPRGAIIYAKIVHWTKKEYAKKIDQAVFPLLQAGPHVNQIAAKALCLARALKPDYRQYGYQVTVNAKALASALKDYGWEIITGGTDNHLFLIDLTKQDITGLNAQDALEKAGIDANKNSIPFDERSSIDPSGIRLGTPAITSRGLKEKQIPVIAKFIHQALTLTKELDKQKQLAGWRKIKKLVADFLVDFPIER